MEDFKQFNHDVDLKEHPTAEIATLWQQGIFSSFNGVDDIQIHYAKFVRKPETNPSHTPCVVIVPGRGESYLKYQEVTFDLFNQGFNIFIIDHRGQGLSQRLLKNPFKGYVKRFQDYVDDLAYFVENIVTPNSKNKPYLLAHSMGGAIATRFMQIKPTAIHASVISSPMLGFTTGFIPFFIAKFVAKSLIALNNLLGEQPWYFLGQKDYSPTSFNDNNLTHSQLRYRSFVELYQRNKSIQLGGVTVHWLMQCIDAQRKIFQDLASLKTPTILLQGGEDVVVCRKAQNNFCRMLATIQPDSCPSGKPYTIDGARHELLFEIDGYRNQALNQCVAWFKKHNQ